MENFYNFKHTNDINITKQRKSILIDRYARFTWRGVDSYDTFGCFITCDKKGLTWVSSAAFSDEYTKPMFAENRAWMGTTFTFKTLTVPLNVYYVTDKMYREVLNWLTPNLISTFSYSYEPGWEYKVKISRISDSTFHTIDYYNGEVVYNVSLTVTFQTIESNKVTYNKALNFIKSDLNLNEGRKSCFYAEYDKNKITELPTSIKITDGGFNSKKGVNYSASIALLKKKENEDDYEIDFSTQQRLFSITPAIDDYSMNFEYNSEEGLLLLNGRLMSLLTVNTTGSEVIAGYQVEKFLLPGVLNNSVLDNMATITFDGQKKNVFPFAIIIENGDELELNTNISIYPTREI